MHSGRSDPQAMGRKGGSVGRGGAARREAIKSNPNLRDYLRQAVSPAEVWVAIKAALEGNSEAARVSASKLLIDSLAEPAHERKQENWVREAAEAFDRKFAARLERQRQIDLRGLRDDSVPAPLRVELERLREVERRYLAIPEAVREEHAPS